ncbi:hypothetical protein, conserved [Trypanosoma cruzi]|uniref:Uncharacterized protein n=2 Tax=Trypanosoma cruzi TaxID=5693 RepID=Q4DDZ5_TRYCC|nr:hypothetical protein, conserved [Trypanosoma cruzi]EAN90750.1 hypothetical protein, conserved [Trypanosoma cruzi]|eukprot:XP_812601.1 hypothetical protein [Trypanosoma cruzi strain CL Brener]
MNLVLVYVFICLLCSVNFVYLIVLFTLKLFMASGKVLADQFRRQGIRYEEASGILWCSLCTNAKGLEIIEVESKDSVLEHCALKRHLIFMEKQLAMDQYCPVEINGCYMLLDHHCVYPAVMFGRGRLLLDDTLGCLIPEDVCGGVKLFPRHKYTVVELIIPHSTVPLPHKPDYFVEREVRSRKCRLGMDICIAYYNKSVEGETAVMKRRRTVFGRVNMQGI